MRASRGLALGAFLGLAACTTNQVGSIPQPRASGLSDVVLQFAVGTATIAVAGGAPLEGTNFVATFRQHSGASAAAGDTPTVTGPGKLDLAGATPFQAIHTTNPADTFESTFGDVIGVFGSGFAPLNIESAAAFAQYSLVGNGSGGVDSLACIAPQPAQSRFGILPAPLYTGDCPPTSSPPPGAPLQMTYAGGPPAWPPSQGYGYPAGFTGFALGFMDFSDVAPVAGTYHLDVAVPTDINAENYQHFGADATLKPVRLAALAQPTISFPGDGSALVSFTVPAGISEAVIAIQRGPCAEPAGFTIPPNVYFALVSHQTGPQTLVISSELGPPGTNGEPTHSFCTAADVAGSGGVVNPAYTLGFVGFDYPAYEASYPANTQQAPKITTGDGHTGTADVTTAVPLSGNYQP
jgi:hypothetical protein